MTNLIYIFAGIIFGLLSGTFGIGGGSLMIPVMVLFFGLTQHQAQGTSLTVMAIPPILILTAMRYYWEGNVKLQMALFIAIGFLIGALIGASWVHKVPDTALKKAFGIYLIIVGIKMFLIK